MGGVGRYEEILRTHFDAEFVEKKFLNFFSVLSRISPAVLAGEFPGCYGLYLYQGIYSSRIYVAGWSGIRGVRDIFPESTISGRLYESPLRSRLTGIIPDRSRSDFSGSGPQGASLGIF